VRDPIDGPRRDPRRLFHQTERLVIAARQHHQCAVCKETLPDVFHAHHRIPWAVGGLTQPDNGIAVCPDCHCKAPIEDLVGIDPRTWQREAMPAVIPILRGKQFATVSAAPGAGKTWFAGWVYQNLSRTGDVARLVVFVPNANLRTQWVDDIRTLNVFLDTPGPTERVDRDGVVMTYHALSDSVLVQQIIDDARATPTLFVLDEVHHLAKGQGGEAGAWAVAVAKIVGDVGRPTHPVLNLSGTLFRSNRDEQISTIRYEPVSTDEPGNIQIATIADYSVTAGRLIEEKQLRHIKVLGFDAEMHISTIDLAQTAHAHAETIHSIDLDGDKQIRSRVLGGMVRSPRFIKGILAETVKRLGHASMALGGASVKGLVIADGIEHANQVYQYLAQEIGAEYAFLAHGQITAAESEIQRFRLSREQAVMVAVQKITEGFNVPDICVLTYLRTWKAPLFINQMVGRAMRVTAAERDQRRLLPATILVPNEEQLKAAFADILVGAMQVLTAPPVICEYCGRDLCTCPPRPKDPTNRVCPTCDSPWRECVCNCAHCGQSRRHGCQCARVTDPLNVDVVGDGSVVHVSVDGLEVNLYLIAAVRESMRLNGLPEVYIEQAAASIQQAMKSDPTAFLTWLRNRHEPL
jgi:superfamily II DNA or RNA helicase